MIRLAALLGLLSLAVLVIFVVRLSGATATLFVFIGFPCLGLALALYGFQRWRMGAFRLTESTVGQRERS